MWLTNRVNREFDTPSRLHPLLSSELKQKLLMRKIALIHYYCFKGLSLEIGFCCGLDNVS